MEHLPLVRNPVFDFRVPCYGYQYDGPPFIDFPERHGWSLLDLELGRSVRPVEEVRSILQAWLYFGMLSEVLGAPVDPWDFIRKDDQGQLLITTSLLHYHLQLWADRTLNLESDAEREISRERSLKCLDIVSNLLNRRSQGQHQHVLPADVDLSIRLLAESLCLFGQGTLWGAHHRVFRDISPQHDSSRNATRVFRSPGFLLDSIVEEGVLGQHTKHWCPALRYRLRNTLGVNGLFHVARTGILPSDKSHGACSDDSCVAYDVHNETYTPKHALGCTGCSASQFPDPGELGRLLRGNHIPLIKLSTSSSSNKSCTARLLPWEPGMKFTAISHVWSDGRGNPRANELPSCQVQWIASHLNASVDSGFDEGFQVTNTDEISRTVAQELHRVDQLLSRPYCGDETRFRNERRPESCSNEEAFKSKHDQGHRSSYKTWVAQAGLAIDTRKQFTGGSVELAEEKSFAAHSAPETSAEDDVKLPEDDDTDTNIMFWMDTLCIPVGEQDRALRKQAISRINEVYKNADRVLVLDQGLADCPLPDNLETTLVYILTSGWIRRLWTLPEGLFAKSLHFAFKNTLFDLGPVTETVSMSLQDATVTGMLTKSVNFRTGTWSNEPKRRLDQLLRHNMVRSRSLSHPGDEALALSIILGLAPAQIKAILQETEHEERMVQLWKTFKEIPLALIFWTGPRLSKPPYRWAPSTLRRSPIRYLQHAHMPFYPVTSEGVKLTGVHSWISNWALQGDLPTVLEVADFGSDLGLIVERNRQAESTRMQAVSQTSDKNLYGIITISMPPYERHCHGILVRVTSKRGQDYFAEFMCNVLVRRTSNVAWEHAKSTFPPILRQMAQLVFGSIALPSAMEVLFATAASEQSWIIG